MANLISLTPSAVERIRHLLATQGGDAEGIKLSVRTAGCNGLAYTVDFAHEAAPEDELVEADGVKVFVPPMAVMHLIGTEVDYVEDKLGATFVFRNPNEKGRCGCGESFRV